MNIKNIPLKRKRIPYYLLLSLLTVGAGIILGFLSFGGMYALYAVLPLAFAAFGLSVLYEGEIYLQNIKASLGKLFKNNYLKNYLAKDYLLKHFPENPNDPECPQFFRDYVKQLRLLETFGHKRLDKGSKQRKAAVERTLKDMEKWFALALFPGETDLEQQSGYSKELHEWIAKNQNQKQWQDKLSSRRKFFHGLKAFSVLSGFFMGLGTTYLIVEAFSVIPYIVATIPFVFWPAIILPMSIIAGAAYGVLTYNSVTDFVNNNIVKKWYKKLSVEFEKGFTARNLLLATSAVMLTGLAIALTICTAGTWWTIATKSRPLFNWMLKLPSFVMGIINPIVTGLSALIFIVQNTGESLEMVDSATKTKGNPFKKLFNKLRNGFHNLRERENWAQILNPFRIILKLTFTPLRLILFFGHLVSIAVTADRVPGIPEIVAAIIAIISEGFEDAHYFFSSGHSHCEEEEQHDHEHPHSEGHTVGHVHTTRKLLEERLTDDHGHSHDNDMPTRLLKLVAHVLYLPAAAWDSFFSRFNKSTHAAEAHDHHGHHHHREVLSFSTAWKKQTGAKVKHTVELAPTAERPSKEWQVEHTVSLIKKHKAKYLKGAVVGKDIAKEKIEALDGFEAKVREVNSPEELSAVLKEEQQSNTTYNKHRMFMQSGDTTTAQFIDKLADRVQSVSAA